MKYYKLKEERVLTEGANSTRWVNISVENDVPSDAVFVMLRVFENGVEKTQRLARLNYRMIFEYKSPNPKLKIDISVIGYAVDKYEVGSKETGIRTVL